MLGFRIKAFSHLIAMLALVDCVVVLLAHSSEQRSTPPADSTMRAVILLFLYNLIAINLRAFRFCHGVRLARRDGGRDLDAATETLKPRPLRRAFLFAFLIFPAIALLFCASAWAVSSAMRIGQQRIITTPGIGVLAGCLIIFVCFVEVQGLPRIWLVSCVWWFLVMLITENPSSPLGFGMDGLMQRGMQWTLLLTGENAIFFTARRATGGRKHVKKAGVGERRAGPTSER